MPHSGEEPPISGKCGSGTIFFSGCNMSCVYCQNYKFSQLNQGREIESRKLAVCMLELHNLGCHNINLVTPTHILPQILKSLSLAIPLGLKLPLVYNSGGYELPEVISLLEGIVDIFLVDMRYAENSASSAYSNARDYPEYNRAAILKIQQQVGT
ncbi:MAG: radical SAM protein, partial [Candidatus Omnitrophica bacterium]|nr:radical SAM protein [Candidatus Omnitrophota bacterium]